jgi:hypothetical protein
MTDEIGTQPSGRCCLSIGSSSVENVFRSFHAQREPRQSTRLGLPRDSSCSRSKGRNVSNAAPLRGRVVRARHPLLRP